MKLKSSLVVVGLLSAVASQNVNATEGYWVVAASTGVGAVSMVASPQLGLSSIQTASALLIFVALYDISANGKESLPVMMSQGKFYSDQKNSTVNLSNNSTNNTNDFGNATSDNSKGTSDATSSREQEKKEEEKAALIRKIRVAQPDARQYLENGEETVLLGETADEIFSAAQGMGFAPIAHMNRGELIQQIATF